MLEMFPKQKKQPKRERNTYSSCNFTVQTEVQGHS